MATSKRNLSDLLRQEAQQERSPIPTEPPSEQQTTPQVELSRLSKAQLLRHIQQLQLQQSAPDAAPNDSAMVAKNQALADQVKALEAKIADQEQAIAQAENTIKTLTADSSAKANLEKALDQQQGLVAQLQAQIQTLEAQQQNPPAHIEERTIEQDRALVLTKISSYQVNLQFPAQPKPSISEEEIGWFD